MSTQLESTNKKAANSNIDSSLQSAGDWSDTAVGSGNEINGQEKSVQRDAFVASVSLLLALTVIQKGLGFVRSVVICRYLPADQLGLWSMTFTFVQTLAPFLILSIPACFGRYFDRFETQRQLRAFIRQCWILIGICSTIGVAGLALFRAPFSELIYGNSSHADMFLIGLAVVIPFGIYGVMASMLTGLRKSQTRTVSEFLNGICFTGLAIVLVVMGRATASTMALAFGCAAVIAGLFAWSRLRSLFRQLPPDRQSLAWKPTWSQMAPVVLVFWLTDFLNNLFFTVDRYMIVNLSEEGTDATLGQVGNYEAAHVLPLLMLSFIAIVAKVILPYLSSDWESGNRKSVATKVNLSVKVCGLVLIFGSTLLLLSSEYLFESLFRGKFQNGLRVLPLIAFFYVGSAMSFLLLNYFWCCEKGKYAVFALIGGLVANVIVNASLIQSMGILGAGIGTAVAVTTQFLTLWLIAGIVGLRMDPWVPIVFLSAGVLLFSPAIALLGSAVLGLLAIGGFMFHFEDRKLIIDSLRPTRSSRS